MTTKKALPSTLLSLGWLASGASQAAGWCKSGKEVKFAELNRGSVMLLTDALKVAASIIVRPAGSVCSASSPRRFD
jgi:glycine betaine/proline transport system substrate-binding protein